MFLKPYPNHVLTYPNKVLWSILKTVLTWQPWIPLRYSPPSNTRSHGPVKFESTLSLGLRRLFRWTCSLHLCVSFWLALGPDFQYRNRCTVLGKNQKDKNTPGIAIRLFVDSIQNQLVSEFHQAKSHHPNPGWAWSQAQAASLNPLCRHTCESTHWEKVGRGETCPHHQPLNIATE